MARSHREFVEGVAGSRGHAHLHMLWRQGTAGLRLDAESGTIGLADY
jgi:hypothetical protein